MCVGRWLAGGRGKGQLASSLTSRRRERSQWLIGETRDSETRDSKTHDDETRLIGWHAADGHDAG